MFISVVVPHCCRGPLRGLIHRIWMAIRRWRRKVLESSVPQGTKPQEGAAYHDGVGNRGRLCDMVYKGASLPVTCPPFQTRPSVPRGALLKSWLQYWREEESRMQLTFRRNLPAQKQPQRGPREVKARAKPSSAYWFLSCVNTV